VVQYQNPALEQVLGYQPAERIGRQTVELVHPDDRGLFVELLRRLDRSYPERVIAELRLRHRDGSWRTLEISAARALDPKGEIVAVVSSRDVTGRRDIEARLRSANRTLSLLRLGNERLVRARGESALAQDICRLVASEGGYQLAWIGYVQDDARGTVKPVAWYGPASGYMEGLLVTSDDSDHGRGPGGSAVRSGRTVYEPDVEASLAMKPWAAQALQHGVRSLLALPLASGGRTFGLMSIYAGAAAAFDVDEISLLEELAGDVAYGITTLRTQRRLGKSLEDAVQAIATAAELRDAYTAGHQRRVSELASAIARRLGLDEHRIRGLHLAGVVHDVGKINIPAEILAKPSRLTAAEYELIKGHPGAGYEILRGIEFPWPVAEIVRQHHELCDGSGYPQGLKGEQILQEARILTVADVVEAMASHRPYRPGLGIDAALAEIARHRGVRYDAQAVDACIALFREHGYRL
jgi:PAS domain S-box-containing protein/putative nucleotidyltransferase with HDIG domain